MKKQTGSVVKMNNRFTRNVIQWKTFQNVFSFSATNQTKPGAFSNDQIESSDLPQAHACTTHASQWRSHHEINSSVETCIRKNTLKRKWGVWCSVLLHCFASSKGDIFSTERYLTCQSSNAGHFLHVDSSLKEDFLLMTFLRRKESY